MWEKVIKKQKMLQLIKLFKNQTLVSVWYKIKNYLL